MGKNGLSIKGSLLSWLGILGGSITLFSNLQTLLSLADWAELLVNLWTFSINVFWENVLSIIHIEVDVGSRFQMTMALCMLLIGLGAYVSNNKNNSDYEDWPIRLSNLFRVNILIGILIFIFHSYLFQNYDFILLELNITDVSILTITILYYSIYALAIFVAIIHWPLSAALTSTIAAIVFSYLFQSAAEKITIFTKTEGLLSIYVGSAIAIFFAMIVLMIAPPKAFAKRLIYIMIGAMIITGLNEISKFNLSMNAPKIKQSNSV